MLEFVIARTDGDYFDLLVSQYPEGLHPITFSSKAVEGSEEWRIQVEGCEVTIVDEDPGYLVSFECEQFDPAVARQIVDEILSTVERVSGQKGRVIEMPCDRPWAWARPPG